MNARGVVATLFVALVSAQASTATTISRLDDGDGDVSAETCYPLHVGDSWTYLGDDGSTRQFNIISTQQINGNTYYRFDDCYSPCGFPGWDSGGAVDLLFRHDPQSGTVLQYQASTSEDVVRYDFSGEFWGCCGNQLVGTDISRTVPAGQFDDCLRFEYGLLVDCGVFFETLAPEVGTIAFFSSWDGQFQLQSYTIIPEPFPLVALLSMGAVALLARARRRGRAARTRV